MFPDTLADTHGNRQQVRVLLDQIDTAFQTRFDDFINSDGGFGLPPLQILEYCDVEILGEDKYIGVPCRRVRFTNTTDPMRGSYIECLVAFEPTIRLLKMDRAGMGDDTPEARVYLKQRRSLIDRYHVIAVDTFQNRLIPTIIEIHAGGRLDRIEISKVELMPADYQGLWEFDGPTGTSVFGELEQVIRKPGIHKKPLMGTGTQIDFTDNEQEAIRQYRVAKNMPVTINSNIGISAYSLLFYISSLASLVGISLIVYRKLRGVP